MPITIKNMGGAIEHWLGFQDKIGRSFMMNEDALKYPLSDYLVNEGGLDIETVELEYPHPILLNRRIDLAVKVAPTSEQIKHAFEFKLAKPATREQTEKQRIFNDLMRLYLARQESKEKCYFIITGKSSNFEQDFRNLKDNDGESLFYKKWFAFVTEESKTFDVATEVSTNYQSIYQTFIRQYSGIYQETGANVLQLPDKITTTCEFVTVFAPSIVPYMAGIWSVS
jgi:hypothetical protein